MILLLAGCLEYGVEGKPPPEIPEVTVAPPALAYAGVCPRFDAEVDVFNEGTGPLRVLGAAVRGDGWALGAVELPFTVAAGASVQVPLKGGPGSATLVIATDDADEPYVSVPLSAEENEHPAVLIVSPYEDAIFPETGDVTLEAFVDDAEDDPDALALAWVSSLGSVLPAAVADPDGHVRTVWPAADRVAGPQTLQLTATDACASVGEATVFYCQDGAYTFDASSLSAWRYDGVAAEVDGEIDLGAAGAGAGSGFILSEVFNADRVAVSFAFSLEGAEGVALTALDGARRTGWLGGDGCGLGYGGGVDCTSGPALPGWTVEVDTNEDVGVDPTPSDHLAFTLDGSVDAPLAWVAVDELDGTGWHTLLVEIEPERVVVSLDGVVRLDRVVPPVAPANA